ncbi:MAG: dihydroorotase [Oscillospiraceae bacterium]|nr:dihydroorotase [Oscillospiraceae bacterium]
MLQSILIKNIYVIDKNYSCDKKYDILIKDGIISRIAGEIDECTDITVNGEGLTAFPGLFDMHVHLRDPGLTHKEDIITGTGAAAAGGVTGLLCMPNTKPCTDNEETIRYITDKAAGTGVKVYPCACITNGMKGEQLSDFEMYSRLGVKAVSDDGRPVESAGMMYEALKKADEKNILVTSHCEDMSIIGKGIMNKGAVSEELGVNGMDRASEDSITAREIALAGAADCRIHIAHVSTKGSIGFIRDAKARGIKVTCETCPHYFILTDEKLRLRDADYRMNPPLRESSDVEAMTEAVKDGTIDCIVTDHAPHAASEKADFEKAPNGVVGLETSFAAAATYLYHTGKISLARLAQLMSENPRKLLGIDPVYVREGYPADMCIADMNMEWTVKPDELHSKSHNTVFKGMKFKGKPVMTISDGAIIYSDPQIKY